ncbi:hypothetical protein [Capnocytophaga leadbetteri]|uniref:hypothetical protein n=1 Tax=Capnocytophaga leadbetteri TaxID=327575 RepID=UPI0028F062EA|nr:hypothetical protein [Capnocytophaga leadbetteri]
MTATTTTHTTKTTIHRARSTKGLALVVPKKKAAIKKKKTIEELAEIAQNIISKYDIKPFNRKELYGNL